MTTVASTALADDYDAFLANRPDMIEDPYPLFARLRDEAPVYRHASHVALTRYRDVAAVLGDRTGQFVVGYAGLESNAVRSAMAQAENDEQRENMRLVYTYWDNALSSMNGEQHDRVRRVAHAAFTPKVIKRGEEQIQEVLDELLEPLGGEGTMDLVADVTWQFPLMIMCKMLDLPIEDRFKLREWSMQLAAMQPVAGAELAHMHAFELAAQACRSLLDYSRDQFARRRAEGIATGDLMGALLASASERRVSDEELTPVITQFIFAGHETTANLLGNAFHALLGEYRDQWEMVCKEPLLAARVADETLRYDNSVTFVARTATEDCEIDHVAIKKFDTIRTGLSAANRDPAEFSEPDRFDLKRERIKHVGLGIGPHYCLGAALARMEVTLMVRALATRFPDIELDGPAIRDTTTHILRGFRTLPVRFSPR
jgi:cytochrome P450